MDFDLTPRGYKPLKPNWTVLLLIAAAACFFGAYVDVVGGELAPNVQQYISVDDIREDHMKRLRQCESSDGVNMIGDGGDSNGWYQIQKPTLEYFMDRYYGRPIGATQLDQNVYLEIVNNFEEAHFWAYYGQYELGLFEWWTCNKLI